MRKCLSSKEKINDQMFINMIVTNAIVCIVCICALFSNLSAGYKALIVCFSLLNMAYITHKKARKARVRKEE